MSHEYADGRQTRRVLDHIDLTVSAGELVALTGPSGSGKSTLLLISAGLEAPTAGQVFVDGEDLWAQSATKQAALRRRHLGFVDQHLNLIATLSAAENVALPLELDGVSRRGARAQARAALESVDLADVADRLPDELSGGEQQRVAIARALIGERRSLIADEPTGSLDSLTGEGVMRLIRRLCDLTGAGALIATHNPTHAAWADRVLYLTDGHLLDETGPMSSAEFDALSGSFGEIE